MVPASAPMKARSSDFAAASESSGNPAPTKKLRYSNVIEASDAVGGSCMPVSTRLDDRTRVSSYVARLQGSFRDLVERRRTSHVDGLADQPQLGIKRPD